MDLVAALIYILCLGILVLPVRFAYLVLISLAFFDASGPQFASATSLGMANAAKVLLAPTILLVKLRGQPLFYFLHILKRSKLIWTFVFFALFASLATLWSPDFLKLSAVKSVSYLWGYLLWFVVLLYGWVTSRIDVQLLYGIWGIGIFLGIVQTYLWGGPFSKGLHEEYLRFTAFSSPQSYAAFYTYWLAVALFSMRSVTLNSFVIHVITLAVLALAGSRYSSLMAIWVVGVWLLYYLRSGFSSLNTVFLRFLLVAFLGLIIIIASPMLVAFLGNTRLAELFERDISTIGTFAWRIGMWSEAWEQIEEFTLGEYIVGKGTAASALVALEYDLRYDPSTIDANRVMHNEFLKTFYEWGGIGLSLFLTFVLGLAFLGFKWLFEKQKRQEAFFLIAILGPLTSGLSIENILAGSGSPVGIGIAMALSYVHARVLGKYAYSKAPHPLPATGR